MSIGGWITDHAGELGLVVGLVPVFLGAIQYLLIKRSEEKARKFENYHRLIKELVQGDGEKSSPFVDRQMAVIYELRNFPAYYPVTKRILMRSKKSWGFSLNLWSGNLIAEADKTLAHIKRYEIEDLYPLRRQD